MARVILLTLRSDAAAFASGLGQAIGALGGFAASVAAAVGEAVNVFSEFDALNRQIAAAMGATTAEMRDLTNIVTDVGIASEFTIPQVQEAARALAQMGATADTLRPLLDVAVNIASVTGSDLPRAAEIAKAQMNSFGLEIEQLNDVQTALIQASTKSAATMPKLATALQFAGQAAAASGQGILDIIPAIEALIDQGLEASIAGTTLRSALFRLASPTAEVREALDRLGIGIAEVNPELVSFDKIIDRIAASAPTLNDAIALFDKRFGGATLQLINLRRGSLRAGDALRSYRAELTDTAESEAKIAQIRAGLQFSFRQIDANIQTVRQTVGQFVAELFDLESVFARIAKGATQFAEALRRTTAEKFKDIVINVVSPSNVGSVFQTAFDIAGPAVFRLFTIAMQGGAAKAGPLLVEAFEFGAPAVGKAIAFVVAAAMIEASALAGKGIATAIIEGTRKVVQLFLEASFAMAKIVGSGIEIAAEHLSARMDQSVVFLIRQFNRVASLFRSESEIAAAEQLLNERERQNDNLIAGLGDIGNRIADQWEKGIESGAEPIRRIVATFGAGSAAGWRKEIDKGADILRESLSGLASSGAPTAKALDEAGKSAADALVAAGKEAGEQIQKLIEDADPQFFRRRPPPVEQGPAFLGDAFAFARKFNAAVEFDFDTTDLESVLDSFKFPPIIGTAFTPDDFAKAISAAAEIKPFDFSGFDFSLLDGPVSSLERAIDEERRAKVRSQIAAEEAARADKEASKRRDREPKIADLFPSVKDRGRDPLAVRFIEQTTRDQFFARQVLMGQVQHQAQLDSISIQEAMRLGIARMVELQQQAIGLHEGTLQAIVLLEQAEGPTTRDIITDNRIQTIFSAPTRDALLKRTNANPALSGGGRAGASVR